MILLCLICFLFMCIVNGIIVSGNTMNVNTRRFPLNLQQHPPQMEMGSFASCIHGGTKYMEGDYFPPNETFIKTDGPQQCVQCRCHQSLVICEIENCPFLECESPIEHSQFCCLQCPGKIDLNKESVKIEFSQLSSGVPGAKKEKTNCLSNGRYREDGSVWQPIIGPFGAMACVQCRCRKGNVICSRLRCKNLPCSHPRREFGECCPVCPTLSSNIDKVKNTQVSCLPKSSEFFVFKTPNVRNVTDKIEYAFLENSSKNDLATVYSWNLRSRSSIDALTVKIWSRKELHKRNLQLLGSITHKRFKKYTKKGEKLRTKCFMQCFKKLQRIENSLGALPVNSRSKCTPDEVEVFIL